MEELFKRLLNYYNLTEEDYKLLTSEVDENNFASGHLFDCMNEACALVKQSMQNKDKILIYGDYDADGIMGTSILVKMFLYLNYKVDYYIPNRYLDGYGINLNQAQISYEKGYKLVICVDNGISAHEPIAYLKEKGIKVLVLDHHQNNEEIPDCDYYLHPTLSHFGETSSSGAFVAFMFSISLLNRFDKYLSTLAAISLISDMMPLKEYNRNLLRLVFKNYKEGEFLAIDSLKENDPFDENTIGMKIAPKINAIGRLIEDESVNNIVRCFISEDSVEILNYISWINEINENRKIVSKKAVDSLTLDYTNIRAIVELLDEKEGVIGLISNHLANKYKCPTIIFAPDSTGEFLKGSCRAPEGYNIVEIFNSLGNVIVAGGGHALAGGCTIKKEDFNIFKDKFQNIVENTKVEIKVENELPFYVTEVTRDNYNLINSFSPFGEGWKAPKLVMKNIRVQSLTYSKNLEHIITFIGNKAKLTGFNFSKSSLAKYQYIDVSGKLKISCWNGYFTTEFLINEIKESQR